jgi:hypothetical protein
MRGDRTPLLKYFRWVPWACKLLSIHGSSNAFVEGVTGEDTPDNDREDAEDTRMLLRTMIVLGTVAFIDAGSVNCEELVIKFVSMIWQLGVREVFYVLQRRNYALNSLKDA